MRGRRRDSIIQTNYRGRPHWVGPVLDRWEGGDERMDRSKKRGSLYPVHRPAFPISFFFSVLFLTSGKADGRAKSERPVGRAGEADRVGCQLLLSTCYLHLFSLCVAAHFIGHENYLSTYLSTHLCLVGIANHVRRHRVGNSDTGNGEGT